MVRQGLACSVVSAARQCGAVSSTAIWIFLFSLPFVTSQSQAAEPGDPLTELRLRVEQLERDNRSLRTSLRRMEDDLADAESGPIDPTQPVFTAFNNLPPAPDEDEPLNQSVERYLKDRDARQLKSDAGRDQKISVLEKGLKDLVDKGSKKSYPNVQINGVFQADTGFFSQNGSSFDAYGPLQAGADFRRARLSAKGSVTEQTNYFFQMDFGFFGRPTFTDVWVEQTKIPFLGTVRVGQWKQPFSLEVVSSFRYTTFMERSTMFQAFTPFRHIGIGFYNNAEDLSATWAASFFRTGQDQYGGSVSNDGGWGTSERVTYLPYWDECSNGREYLHLGFGHFFNAPPKDTINFRTVPEMFIGESNLAAANAVSQSVPTTVNGTPFFVQTGSLTHVQAYNVLGTEMLWVEGPLSFQSEAMLNIVDQGSFAKTAFLPGAYAQVGYFLTGEHRPYDRKAGAIDRIMPRKNLFYDECGCEQGYGAWEIAGRFSYLDLNDQNIRGGIISDYTIGLNWYLNPYTKVVFNYIHSVTNLDGVAAYAPSPITGLSPKSHTSTDLFGMRVQIDF